MILVNFKAYKETFGEGAIRLARVCKEVEEETGVEIVPVVSALDVYRVKKEVGNKKVFIQSVDNIEEGKHTGGIVPWAAKDLGADGVVLNHSEKRLRPGTIKQLIARLPTDWTRVVCLQSLGQAEKWGRSLEGAIIAYEPKELIGSTDKSVASEKGETIRKMVELLKDNRVIVGAGIHSGEDIEVGYKMGAKGVILATNIVKAENPKANLLELAKAVIKAETITKAE